MDVEDNETQKIKELITKYWVHEVSAAKLIRKIEKDAAKWQQESNRDCNAIQKDIKTKRLPKLTEELKEHKLMVQNCQAIAYEISWKRDWMQTVSNDLRVALTTDPAYESLSVTSVVTYASTPIIGQLGAFMAGALVGTFGVAFDLGDRLRERRVPKYVAIPVQGFSGAIGGIAGGTTAFAMAVLLLPLSPFLWTNKVMETAYIEEEETKPLMSKFAAVSVMISKAHEQLEEVRKSLEKLAKLVEESDDANRQSSDEIQIRNIQRCISRSAKALKQSCLSYLDFIKFEGSY